MSGPCELYVEILLMMPALTHAFPAIADPNAVPDPERDANVVSFIRANSTSLTEMLNAALRDPCPADRLYWGLEVLFVTQSMDIIERTSAGFNMVNTADVVERMRAYLVGLRPLSGGDRQLQGDALNDSELTLNDSDYGVADDDGGGDDAEEYDAIQGPLNQAVAESQQEVKELAGPRKGKSSRCLPQG